MGASFDKRLLAGAVSIFALACWSIFASAAWAELIPPERPVCNDSAVTVQVDTPTTISFDCSDARGAGLDIRFMGGLEHGSIEGHPNPFMNQPITPYGTLQAVYIPDAGYTGNDYLTIRAAKYYMPPCPGPFACPQVMSEIYSNNATVSINVVPPEGSQGQTQGQTQGQSSFASSCSSNRTQELRSKLKKSRKRYKALKRRYKRYRSRAKNVRSGKLRRRYRSKAKRIRKSYRKTGKRSKRLRKKIVSCRAAGY